MLNGEDLVAHIQRFNQVCSEVMSLDVKIDEKDWVLLLLCSLLGSYDGLISTLVYGKEILNYKEIVGVLRLTEHRKRICKQDLKFEILVVNERQKRSMKNTKKNPRVGQNLKIRRRY